MSNTTSRTLEIIAATALTAVAFTVLILLFPTMKSSDVASWVQALGSIAAIGIAIWVSHHQHEKQVERDCMRDEADELSMLHSLRDEITSLWDIFELRVGQQLANDPDGTAFLSEWPIQESPFAVYDACVDRIGKIKNHVIRQKIIVTYAYASGLISSFKGNNQMIQKFDAVQALADQTNSMNDIARSAHLLQQLQAYADAIRESRIEVEKMVADLLSHLPKPN
ncbi:hypothetical protein [Janthinobacterium sp. 17J80-10]|uniref:hypothetical protein n=1 Tax=Janthinobacterium sp. 17J80-10 TaxID=2497863 RepID=UPI0010053C1F|nr:hypothetical protein [Janthinobacterium sp. 17J80-10]QAU33117.1 hypothetical protein EKL02_02395 [Janthinobacterium sp. 17J80-10]